MQARWTVLDSGLPLLQPDWPAPPGVFSGCTTRQGGESGAPWDSLNLGDHVGDASASVSANRARLQHQLDQQGAGRLQYLRQVHGVDVIEPMGQGADDSGAGVAECVAEAVADGAISQNPKACLIILVADCLPILLTDRAGQTVAALHAGWRGLAGRSGVTVISRALAAFAARGSAAADLLAWLGPCIGRQAFEVGDDVRQAFAQSQGAQSGAYFQPSPLGAGAADLRHPRLPKWQADLAGLARAQLHSAGVGGVYGNDSSPAWCTVGQADLFFSHRRDSPRLGASGRFGACIGLRA